MSYIHTTGEGFIFTYMEDPYVYGPILKSITTPDGKMVHMMGENVAPALTFPDQNNTIDIKSINISSIIDTSILTRPEA